MRATGQEAWLQTLISLTITSCGSDCLQYGSPQVKRIKTFHV